MNRKPIPSFTHFYYEENEINQRREVAEPIWNNFDYHRCTYSNQRNIIQKVLAMANLKVLIFIDIDSLRCLDKISELHPDLFHVVIISNRVLDTSIESHMISIIYRRNISNDVYNKMFKAICLTFHQCLRIEVIFCIIQNDDIIKTNYINTFDERKSLICKGYRSKDFIYLLLHHLVTNGVELLIKDQVKNLTNKVSYEVLEYMLRTTGG